MCVVWQRLQTGRPWTIQIQLNSDLKCAHNNFELHLCGRPVCLPLLWPRLDWRLSPPHASMCLSPVSGTLEHIVFSLNVTAEELRRVFFFSSTRVRYLVRERETGKDGEKQTASGREKDGGEAQAAAAGEEEEEPASTKTAQLLEKPYLLR